jgi:hypothetical protein
MLRKLIIGRLTITPNADLTEFVISDEGVIEPLLDQYIHLPKAVVTPAGFDGLWNVQVRRIVRGRVA